MSTASETEQGKKSDASPLPLSRWLWQSYLRSAIIPLLFIELSFLAIYWISNAIVYRQNVSAVRELSHDYLGDVVRREAMSIGNSLEGVSQITTLYARQALKALEGNYVPPAAERARYAPGPKGGLHTTFDNGTTASFYSNVTRIGPEQMDKVWRLSALDPLMMDIRNSNPLVASLYFNTNDSYNRIYPYFKVLDQYPWDMAIPSYNFYYEADAKHNPQRKAVWTDAYIDPAGHGWMVSSIAPVWRGSTLEGVVGIDVTLETMIDRILKLDLPWDAYAVLLDRKGRIIAMPPAGEDDFRLKELTTHSYAKAIMADTFKPESFNINNRKDTQALASALAKAEHGEARLNFDGPHLATFSHIAGPDWTLVIIAPEQNIYAQANALRDRLRMVGYVMVGGLLVFYVIFFVFLYQRAHAMSTRVAEPLGVIARLIERIGKGQFRQRFDGSRVRELDLLGHQLVATGNQLGDANERIVEQERIVSLALARQQQVNEEQTRFVRVMSHELRTPLSVIDSGAQILDRRAESLTPDDLRKRSAKLRGAVRRISDLLHKLVGSVPEDAAQSEESVPTTHDLVRFTRELAQDMVGPDRLRLRLPDEGVPVGEAASLAIALRAVLDNAVRYTPGDTPVTVSLDRVDGAMTLKVEDCGPGIPVSEQQEIGKRFFRGANATGTDGAGVGLYVARKLVETLGGTLVISSQGTGTSVTFSLPVDDDQRPIDAGEANADAGEIDKP